MKCETAQDSLDKKLKDVIEEHESLKSVIKEQDGNINNLKNMIEMSNSKLMELMDEMKAEIQSLKEENHSIKQNHANISNFKKDIAEIDSVISSLATETENNSSISLSLIRSPSITPQLTLKTPQFFVICHCIKHLL
jgi:chromosome segregation ATPase